MAEFWNPTGDLERVGDEERHDAKADSRGRAYVEGDG